nr:DUF6886 family protein [Bacillus sp. FJAT-50079]
MKDTKLYLYEFASTHFTHLDENAGYYTSEITQIPIAKIEIEDIFAELFARRVELRIVDHLWDISDVIQKTTFHWSLCRMGFAKPRLVK